VTGDIVARAVLGGKFTHQEEFHHELNKVIDLMGGFILADLFPSSWLVRWLSSGERNIRTSYGLLQRILTDIIDGRRAARTYSSSTYSSSSRDDEDLLDVLLRLQEEDSLSFPLTSEIIGAVIFDIFSAASETTGSTIGWAMSELCKNTEAMAKAQQEVREIIGKDRAVITSADLKDLHYMRMVIKEVLRLHAPTPFLVPRLTTEDCEIMGYDISKGTNIFVNIFSISRDPKYWENPNKFKPERFHDNNIDYQGANFEFTPFGAGRRQCPGILFGISTVEIVLANLLYHFDWLLPDGSSPDSLDMSEKFGSSVRRKSDLKLIATPYPDSMAI
jgi:cytochrome P450